MAQYCNPERKGLPVMNTLKGKTTLITGGLSGIGYAVAKQAAADGNHLVLVQRRSSEELVQKLIQLGASKVDCLSIDLGVIENIDLLAQQLETKKISVDILFNNAGILTGGVLEEQDPIKIEKMLVVNVTTPILLTRKLLPGMLKRNFGKIVNNCSVTGRIPIPSASTYGASKAALIHFTNCLRQELKDTNVATCAVITPGVKTDMFDDIKKEYKKNMDTSFLTSITADHWAEKIWKAVENNTEILLPTGTERMGVFLSTYFPSLIEGKFSQYFQRNSKTP